MSLKYECFYCKCIFPAEDIVDGYNQGYKAGFICPECGQNIQAKPFLLRRKIDPKDEKWVLLLYALLLSMFITKFSDRVIEVFSYEVNIFIVALTSTFIYMLVLFFLKPSFITSTTTLTRPVSSA